MFEYTRPDPPGLIIQPPLCPMCKSAAEFDGDGYRCRPCGAGWHGDPEDSGLWEDEDEPQCTSQADASKVGGGTYRCIKGASHVDGPTRDERKHHNGQGATWPNPWLPEIEPAVDAQPAGHPS